MLFALSMFNFYTYIQPRPFIKGLSYQEVFHEKNYFRKFMKIFIGVTKQMNKEN